MIYVKTVYGTNSYRLPDISTYSNDKSADLFINTCIRWGIDIVSCEKISKTEANGLLGCGKAVCSKV